MNPLQERLHIFLNHEDISLRSFERKCGINAGTASKMTEKSYGTTFHKIVQSYPQLNINWLKTGEGEMLNPQPQKKIEVGMGVGEVSGGKVDFRFEIGKELIKDINIDDNAVCKQQYLKLKSLLAKADQEISKLEGKVEEQDKFVKLLLDRK